MLRPIARLSKRSVWWKLILEPSLFTKRITGQGSYPWQNLLIITQNTQARGINLSSSIAGTTYAFPTKSTSTPAPGPKQLIGWPKNLGILWMHAEKTYNTPKNCKNEPIIKELSLEVTFSARRFSLIANISKLNSIGSWRRSYLGLFKFCTWCVAKRTNSNC